MYAVVRTGSKQYRVEPGYEFLVEKLEVEPGQSVELSDVLCLFDGSSLSVGSPKLNATVTCKVVAQELGPKLRTVKYKRRHNYKKTYGHRQAMTRLLVEKLDKKGN